MIISYVGWRGSYSLIAVWYAGVCYPGFFIKKGKLPLSL